MKGQERAQANWSAIPTFEDLEGKTLEEAKHSELRL